MFDFNENILSLFGDEGQKWLDKLDEVVNHYKKQWQLQNCQPVTNLTFHYIVKAYQNNMPVILKLGFDQAILEREAKALKAFHGQGAVKLLAQDKGALLLQQVSADRPLKEFYPDNDLESVRIAAMVMQRLHQASFDPKKFITIEERCKPLDINYNQQDDDLTYHLKRASTLKNELLSSSPTLVLCHGDCHHDNILNENEDWFAIDPVGLIAEPAVELAPFLRNPMPQLIEHPDLDDLLKARIAEFADIMKLDESRIKKWNYVLAILAWCWAIEDNLSTDYFSRISSIMEKLL